MVSVYVHAKRIGWKIRPRPKTVILKKKKKKKIQMIHSDVHSTDQREVLSLFLSESTPPPPPQHSLTELMTERHFTEESSWPAVLRTLLH